MHTALEKTNGRIGLAELQMTIGVFFFFIHATQ